MLPLFSEEVFSDTVAESLRTDDGIVVWWGTWAECAVAISRLKREGSMDDDIEEEARAALDQLAEEWTEIRPVDELRFAAMLVSVDHPLKAADCLQLAAALRWCEGHTSDAELVCLDEKLRDAAADEGFEVLPELPDEEGDP